MELSEIFIKKINKEKVKALKSGNEYIRISYDDEEREEKTPLPLELLFKDVIVYSTLHKSEKAQMQKFKVKLEEEEFKKLKKLFKKLGIEEEKQPVYKTETTESCYLSFSEFLNTSQFTAYFDEAKKNVRVHNSDEITDFFSMAKVNIVIRISIINYHGYPQIQLKQARIVSKKEVKCLV